MSEDDVDVLVGQAVCPDCGHQVLVAEMCGDCLWLPVELRHEACCVAAGAHPVPVSAPTDGDAW